MAKNNQDFHSKKAGTLARHHASHQRSQARAATHSQVPYMDLAANRTVFRGDTRPPSIIFTTGFAKRNPTSEITLSGEKIKEGISTSLNASIVRRKYGIRNGYVYVIYLNPGDAADFSDPGFNDLEEITALFIPTQKIIGVAGPIKSTRDGYSIVGSMLKNPHCSAPAHIIASGMNQLEQFFVVAEKSVGGSFEV